MSGVPKRARKASEHVKREEGGVKLQQDRRTEGAELSILSFVPVQPVCTSRTTSTRLDGNRLPCSGPRPPPVLSSISPVVELLQHLP